MATIITPEMEQLCLDEVENWIDLIESARKKKKSNWRFTPTESALITLANLPENTWIEGLSFLDAECGIGQLLVPAAIIKRELGHSDILSTIYGVEIHEPNARITRMRLINVCEATDENIALAEKNIVCADSQKYDYMFNG